MARRVDSQDQGPRAGRICAPPDNPAWIFFDLVSNDRYGLGERIPSGWLDKWGLYQIARYCDELVPDGFGGQEPRFTCNAYVQTAADAYRVLQDLASTFRGIAYWARGVMTMASRSTSVCQALGTPSSTTTLPRRVVQLRHCRTDKFDCCWTAISSAGPRSWFTRRMSATT